MRWCCVAIISIDLRVKFDDIESGVKENYWVVTWAVSTHSLGVDVRFDVQVEQ